MPLIIAPSVRNVEQTTNWSGTQNVTDTTKQTVKIISAGQKFIVTGLCVLTTAGSIESIDWFDDTTEFFSMKPLAVNVPLFINFGVYNYKSIVAGNDLKAALKAGANTTVVQAYGLLVNE